MFFCYDRLDCSCGLMWEKFGVKRLNKPKIQYTEAFVLHVPCETPVTMC